MHQKWYNFEGSFCSDSCFIYIIAFKQHHRAIMETFGPNVIWLYLFLHTETLSYLHLTELAQEANPSDHPRASTLFLNKSQTDGQYFSVKDLIRWFLFNLTDSFLSISVREKRKSNYMNHVSFVKNLLNAWLTGVSPAKRLKLSSHLLQMSPGLLTKKYSSCSTIFIDDSTVSQPNLKSTIKWWLYLRLLNVVTEMVLHFEFWCPVFLEPAVFIWRL